MICPVLASQTLSNINQNNAQYITLQYTCIINVSVLYSVCRTVCPLPARTRTAHCDNDNDAHVLHYKRCGISSTRVAEMQIEMSRGVDTGGGGGESFAVQPGHTLARKECESQIKSNGQHKRNAQLNDSN